MQSLLICRASYYHLVKPDSLPNAEETQAFCTQAQGDSLHSASLVDGCANFQTPLITTAHRGACRSGHLLQICHPCLSGSTSVMEPIRGHFRSDFPPDSFGYPHFLELRVQASRIHASVRGAAQQSAGKESLFSKLGGAPALSRQLL